MAMHDKEHLAEANTKGERIHIERYDAHNDSQAESEDKAFAMRSGNGDAPFVFYPIASPDGALAFLFAIFGLLMWYVSVFDHLSDSTLLSISMVWLLLSLGTLCASLINMLRGHSRGNTNLLATILLGFIPGIDTLAALFMRSRQMVYQPEVYGIMYVIGALFIFGAAWRRKAQPGYIFLRTIAIGSGLLFLGTGDLLKNPVLREIGGWFVFAFALLSFYYGLSRMYEEFGFSLPQGKAFFSNDHSNGVHKMKSLAYAAHPLMHRYDVISSPQMIVSFICATFGMLSFASAFFPLADDSILATGIMRLLLGGIYFLSALINLFKGSPYGSINLIFSVCFGLFAGSTLMIQALNHLLHFDVAPLIYGVLQMFAGLYLLCLIPALRKSPLYRMMSMIFAGSGLFFASLDAFFHAQVLMQTSGFLFMLFALLNIYAGLSALLPDLRQGPSAEEMARGKGRPLTDK